MAKHPNNLRSDAAGQPLDRIDRGILGELSQDARLSNKELAARVNLAESTCLERVRRLRASGALRGFHADVNPAALGLGIEAMIAVRLRQHSRNQVEGFQAHLHALPEILASYHLAGVNDFLIHVAVRDTAHLRDLVVEAFTARPEVVHIETALIFEHRRGRLCGLPIGE